MTENSEFSKFEDIRTMVFAVTTYDCILMFGESYLDRRYRVFDFKNEPFFTIFCIFLLIFAISWDINDINASVTEQPGVGSFSCLHDHVGQGKFSKNIDKPL